MLGCGHLWGAGFLSTHTSLLGTMPGLQYVPRNGYLLWYYYCYYYGRFKGIWEENARASGVRRHASLNQISCKSWECSGLKELLQKIHKSRVPIWAKVSNKNFLTKHYLLHARMLAEQTLRDVSAFPYQQLEQIPLLTLCVISTRGLVWLINGYHLVGGDQCSVNHLQRTPGNWWGGTKNDPKGCLNFIKSWAARKPEN